MPGTAAAIEYRARSRMKHQVSLSDVTAEGDSPEYEVAGRDDNLFAGLDGQVYKYEADSWSVLRQGEWLLLDPTPSP